MASSETVDLKDLVARCSGDTEFATTMLSAFPQHSAKILVQIQEALASRDLPKLRQSAHALKGMSANLSAIHVARLAGQLEHLAMSNPAEAADLIAIASTVAELSEAYQRCLEAIPAVLTRLAA